MFDRLIESVEKTFVQFSFRRLMFLVFLLALVGSVGWYLDHRTGYTSFLRLQRVLSSLERLHALESAGITRSEALAPLYESTVNSLEDMSEPPTVTAMNPLAAGEPLVKFLSATGFVLLFAGWGAVKVFLKDPEGLDLFLGALIIVFVLGIPALLVPTIGSLRWTALGLFVLQILFFLALNIRQNRKNASTP